MFPFLELYEIPCSPFFQHCLGLSGSTAVWYISTPSHSLLLATLLMVHCVSSCGLLMKMLNSAGPSLSAGEVDFVPLVTAL